jgi:hypothetical protein
MSIFTGDTEQEGRYPFMKTNGDHDAPLARGLCALGCFVQGCCRHGGILYADLASWLGAAVHCAYSFTKARYQAKSNLLTFIPLLTLLYQVKQSIQRQVSRNSAMDPATILSVTATCGKVAKTAWDLGEALCTFTKDAKVINKTLNSLIEQSRAVRDPCELLAVFLKSVSQHVDAHPAWAATCHGMQLGNTLKVLQRQLIGCEDTLESLSKSTEGICSTDTASAKKAWATFKFDLRKDSMREHRSQLSVHPTALNISLHIFSWSVSRHSSLCRYC